MVIVTADMEKLKNELSFLIYRDYVFIGERGIFIIFMSMPYIAGKPGFTSGMSKKWNKSGYSIT